ncbi:DoxX family protein [Haloarcula sp. S1CR25-12]|uniref:DoxX family protein n=1 Tax=Haloarcula saliterrae TaxID=2950534 RepID=A0ABU2F7Z0_9EURY|nr:DoxX family protein [Haloarcula sp. S1CR25-12]MDS0257965.1 DoxX family protein [Haloarcula sp. S1CR25-12]
MPFETTAGAATFLAGRALLGGVFAYLGVSNLLDVRAKIAYARDTGIPLASVAVPAAFVLLVIGGLGVLTGVYPAVASLAIIAFFAGVTPAMHAFWRIEDPDERESEKTQFLLNTALLGSALVLLALGGTNWPYGL